MTWYTCTVNEAGPADDATETPDGSVYINLTDQGGAFTETWFYCAAGSKSYMLAVALAAISIGAQVEVGAFPPDPGGGTVLAPIAAVAGGTAGAPPTAVAGGTAGAPPTVVASGTGTGERQSITEIQRLYLIAPGSSGLSV
jgi:hypothetical protein